MLSEGGYHQTRFWLMKPDCENRLIMTWPKSDALQSEIPYVFIYVYIILYIVGLYISPCMANTCIIHLHSIKVPHLCGDPRNFEDGLVCTVQLCHQEIQQEHLRFFLSESGQGRTWNTSSNQKQLILFPVLKNPCQILGTAESAIASSGATVGQKSFDHFWFTPGDPWRQVRQN